MCVIHAQNVSQDHISKGFLSKNMVGVVEPCKMTAKYLI